MRKALFIALGIMAVIFGLECLAIDSAILYDGSQSSAAEFIDPTSAPSESVKEWRPKDWMPWAIIAGGVITILYSFSLPYRWKLYLASRALG